jgi:hypothetical protein
MNTNFNERYKIINSRIDNINKNLINKCALLENKCALLDEEMNSIKKHNEYMKYVLNKESSRINNLNIHNQGSILYIKSVINDLQDEINYLNSEVATKDLIINNLRKKLNS